jgi:uncharacterized protein (TIGR02611 family)
MNFYVYWTLKNTKRLIVAVVGLTVLLLGIALIFFPGPAFIVIPVGLAILATEFAWAHRLLKRVKKYVTAKNNKYRSR